MRISRMPDEIRYLGDLQLLRIETGDKFVLKTDKPVSQEIAARILEQWQRFAGEDVPLLILDSGMTLGAIRTTPESTT